jgi:hypothetical protein
VEAGGGTREKKKAAGNPLSADGLECPLLLPKGEDTTKLGQVCGACKPNI